ncbi:predicted protein [Nematostella vectensis]|uniref:NTR domain-containing protein n=1 Tax=Nematostella vectensis TaxID=45351 RepID=A7RH10_NEMVE|nr:predicted protein [Nematostella vectensis]|eukprot:XP_001641336.1 predicted protein [Nematostella vectensis]
MKGIIRVVLVAIYLGTGSAFLCYPEHIQSQFCNSDYVFRVKVKSGPKFEVPPLPAGPEPPRPGKDNNNNNNNNNGNKDKDKEVGPDPLISEPAPVIRGREPRAAASTGGHPPRILTFQEVTIKRLLRGKSKVNKTKGFEKFTKNLLTRYNARVYTAPKVKLEPNKAYLVAGKVIDGRLWISYCNLHTEWDHLSKSQLGGLKKYYQQGCNKCKVQLCFSASQCERMTAPDRCMWQMEIGNPTEDCYVKASACKKVGDRCMWKNEKSALKCKKEKKQKKEKKNNNKTKIPLP